MSADLAVQRDVERPAGALLGLYPGRKWHAGPFFPQDLVEAPMLAAGFYPMDLAQWQFRLPLADGSLAHESG